MFRYFPRLQSLVLVAGAMAALSASAFAAGIDASAILSSTQIAPGEYNYQITVSDTGTTPIGTFWFSWIPGAGFLPAAPTDVDSPTGWTDKLTSSNAAIQWTTTTNLLEPGESLPDFSFDSTTTPEQLLGDGTYKSVEYPILTSFVYAGAPLVGVGDQFVVAETPEPGTLTLAFTGLGLAAAFFAFRQRRGALKTSFTS